MKNQNALVSNIFDRWQRYFAHVTTVRLSWRVQNIVVIGCVYFTLECFEFSSNFEFDRNMLSGTGAWFLFLLLHFFMIYVTSDAKVALNYIMSHYNDVIMSAMTFQITSASIVYSTVCSAADQSKHQSSASMAFVRGIHRRPVDSSHKKASNTENVSIWWRHHDFHGACDHKCYMINGYSARISRRHPQNKSVDYILLDIFAIFGCWSLKTYCEHKFWRHSKVNISLYSLGVYDDKYQINNCLPWISRHH